MLNCPFCKNPYDSESMVDGRCPNCGGKLNWSSGDQDDSVDPGFTPNVTVSLGPSFLSRKSSGVDGEKLNVPAVKPIELKIGEATIVNKETVLSSESVDDVGGKNLVEPSSSGSKSNYKRSLSTDDIDRLGGIWEVASLETDNPMSTLRTSAEESSQPLDVVINERRFQNTRELPQFAMDYEILKQIGQGAVGVVYSAQQNSINRNVAVKMLNRAASQDEDQKDKFLFEAVVTGELDHPNIVPIHDVGKNQDGELFYSMKQVVGTPWSESIKKKSISENLEVLLKVCDAVSFAHAKGIVHRDLKPENTMLGQYGEVLVVDWGIALPFGDFSKMSDVLSKPGIAGTPAYMAPEMATGPLSKIGPLSDVYLLGASLFEMITGKTPHRGLKVMDCVVAAADNHIVSTDNNGELIQIAYRAMATEPKDRYGSAAEFKDALHQYQSHLESISLANRAQEGLEEAKASGDYQEYAHAQFAFQEALDLWPQNKVARDGVVAVKLSYAQKALEQGDFELGLSLVDVSDVRFKSLGRSLRAGLKSANNRRKNVRRLVSALVIGSLIASGIFYWLLILAQNATDEAQKEKVAAKKSAEREEDSRIVAERRKDDAIKATKAARKAKEKAETGRIELKKEELKSQRDSYFFSLGSVTKNLDFNEFAQARRKLRESKEKTTNLGIRHCEWGLLDQSADGDYLELDGLNLRADKNLISSFATDKTSIALAYKGKFEVRSFSDIKNAEQSVDIELESIVSIVPLEIGNQSCWFVAGNGNDSAQGSWVGVVKKDQNENLEFTELDKFAGLNVTCLAASSKSEPRVLIGFGNGEIRLFDYLPGVWKAVTFESNKGFEGLVMHIGGVLSCDFQPETNSSFVTSGQDGKVLHFRLKAEEGVLERKQFLGHGREPVQIVRFSTTGDSVASAGNGGKIFYYPVGSFQTNKDLKEAFEEGSENKEEEFLIVGSHLDAVRTLQFSNMLDGNKTSKEFLLSGGDDNQINIWSVPEPGVSASSTTDKQNLVRTFKGHSRPIEIASFVISQGGGNSAIPNSIYSLTSGVESELAEFFKWTIETPAPVEDYRHDKQVISTAISPESNSLVLGTMDGVSMIELDGLPPEVALEFASSNEEVFNLKQEANVWTEGHEYLAYRGLAMPSISAFQGRELLLTCGGDDTTILWDHATGTHLQKFSRTGRRGLLTVARGCGVFATGASFKEEERSTLLRVFRPLTTPSKSQYFSEKPISLTCPWVRVDDDRPDLTVISISGCGHWLVGGSSRGELHLWQVGAPDTPIRKMGVVNSPVVSVEWLSNGSNPEDGLKFLATFRNGLSCEFFLDQSGDANEIKRGESVNVVNSILNHRGKDKSPIEGASLKLIRSVLSPEKDLILHVIQETEYEKTSNKSRRILKSSDIYLGLFDLKGEIKGSDFVSNSVCSAAAFRTGSNEDILLATKLFRSEKETGQGNEFIMLWRALADPERRLCKLVDTGSAESVVDLGFPFSDRELLMVRSDGPALLDLNLQPSGDSESKTNLQLFQGQGGVNCVAYSSDGKYILTGGVDGSAKIWDVQKKNGQPIMPIMKFQNFRKKQETTVNESEAEISSWGEVTAVYFGNQGNRVIIGTQKGVVSVFERNDEKSEWSGGVNFKVQTDEAVNSQEVTALVASPDEKHLLISRIDGRVDVYGFESSQHENSLKHPASVSCLAFSENGELLIVGSADSNAYLWEFEELAGGGAALGAEENAKTLSGHSAEIVSVEFSLDRTRVLTASKDKTAKLWSLNQFLAMPEGANQGGGILQVGTLASHNSPLVSAHFCHDGKNIVTTDTNFSTRLWRGSAVEAGLVLSPIGKLVTENGVSEGLLDSQAIVTLPSGKTLEGYELVVTILPAIVDSHTFEFLGPIDQDENVKGTELRLQFTSDWTPDIVEKLIRSLGIRVTAKNTDGSADESATAMGAGVSDSDGRPTVGQLDLTVEFELRRTDSKVPEESKGKSRLPEIELKIPASGVGAMDQQL